MSERGRPQALRSALAQAGADQVEFRTERLAFREIEARAAVCLRALSANAGNQGGPISLPIDAGECSGKDPAILCLRPGEWLVVSQSLAPHELLEQVRARHGDPGYFSWDLSEALAMFRVEGQAAPWLLRKHCGLDIPVDPKADCPGQAHCAQTRFAHISALMHYHINEAACVFDIYVDRSLALYFWNLLADSAHHAVQLSKRQAAEGGNNGNR